MHIRFFSRLKPFLLFKISLIIVVLVAFRMAQEPSASQIVYEMFTKTKEIKSMIYTMQKKERINGEMQSQESTVKLNLNPFMMYLRQKAPKDGLEVLYKQGENDNKAVINTNGFPWMNVSLDPMGDVMRNNQHHTVYQSGYAHLMSILEHLILKYQKELEVIMVKKNSIVWEGQDCWVIVFTNPHFHFYKHTMRAGESILGIATKEKLSEHMIMERNPTLKSFTDVKAGQVIELPNDYSSKLELYIEKNRMIPLVMKVYDNQGLYEYYEYNNVKLNPTFDSNDFNKDNPNYGF